MLQQSNSPFVFTGNNPILRIDPDGLTDINIHIHRFYETKKSTLGILRVTNSGNDKALAGVTLEPPDKNNQKDVSRINADTYSATRTWRDDAHDNADCIRLENKHQRTDVLIHEAKTGDPGDTKGCPLPGTSYGKDHIDGSKTMMKNLIRYVDRIIKEDKKKKETTNINVLVEDIGKIERLSPSKSKPASVSVPTTLPLLQQPH